MSQHDYNLENAAGAAFRTDMNNALLAIVSNNSGATEPAAPNSFQWWADTTTGLLKIRNAANSGWVTVLTMASANGGLASLSGSTFTGALLAAVGTLGAPGLSWSGDSDSGFWWVSSNTWAAVSNGVEQFRISTAGITFSGTGATTFPSGTTAQRPGTPVNGMIRYNSTLTSLDVYANGAWGAVPAATAYPFATADLANTVTAIAMIPFEYSSTNSTTLIYPQFGWTSPIKQTNPTSLPAGNGSAAAMSLNSEFVTIGHSTTPFFSNYIRNGVELVKLADPASLPASAVVDAAYSPSGEFLAVATASTPYLAIYQRATGTHLWVKLTVTAPDTIPTGAGNGLSWCPNSEYLACNHTTSPYTSVYKRSGATFAKLIAYSSQFSTTLPTGTGNGSAWDATGSIFMVAHGTTPFVSFYKRTGDTIFTIQSNPSLLPPSAGLGCAISNNQLYFAVVSASSPYVTVYERSYPGSVLTFTKMVAGDTSQFADSADFPTGQANRVAFSLDSTLMAVAHNTSPYVSIYSLSAGKWVKQANPATLPTGNGTGVCFNSEKEFLLTSHTTTPYLTFYQTSSDMTDNSILTIQKIPRAGSIG